MLYRQYLYKYYLNITHAIRNGIHEQDAHEHVWEISFYVLPKEENGILQLEELKQFVNQLMEPWQKKNLNQEIPFNKVNPLPENVGDYFYEKYLRAFYEAGYVLAAVEISETPYQTYLVSGIAADDYTFS